MQKDFELSDDYKNAIKVMFAILRKGHDVEVRMNRGSIKVYEIKKNVVEVSIEKSE